MITKETSFKEVIEKYPKAIEIFLKYGMHCIGCPIASQETIEQGCIAHNIDVEKLLKELNEVIKNES